MSTPVLELKDVSKLYTLGDQKLYALNKVSLKILKGEFVAIVGSSGSGKSTFLHMASLLDSPTSGQVFLLGKKTNKYSEPARAKLRNKEIGFIFQQFNLLKKTSAIENVALPLRYAGNDGEEMKKAAIEMLTKVGLGDRLYNTPAQLSGGQQQRVAIARALINNPSIIFADEPTGNLDSKSGKEIQNLLLELHKDGATIVMVTHSKTLAQVAERIVELKDGQVISDKKQS